MLRSTAVGPRIRPLPQLVASLLLAAGCATGIDRDAMPFASPVIEVRPGAAYQRCVGLKAGERLFFSYRTDPPMAFSIRRQSAEATLSYVVREASRDDSGIFVVPQSERYCLHWTPVDADSPWPTLLRYELRVSGGT